MTVGVFYAWDFLFLIIATLFYYYSPACFIKEKQEYVKFALLFFTVYFFVFIVLKNLYEWSDLITHEMWWTFLFPCLWLGHYFYPFHSVKRNQHLNFFLFFAAFYAIALYGFSMLVNAFSNM